MHAFEAIIVILLASVALRAVATRFGAPYPALLALAGAALAVSPVPVALPFALDPQLVLALFVAPVLLDAAYDTSPRDLKHHWRPVLSLVLVAVGLTTGAVALVAHWLVPGLPWAAAITLGAIVAPPDAAAAATVLRTVGLPHRLLVILEGESLLNDASSLLIYRLAVGAAAAGGTLDSGDLGPAFALSIIGSLVAGPAIAWVWHKLTARAADAPAMIVMQFVGTFGVWILAEAVGLSPILTLVTYGMTIARWAPTTTPARLRVPSYAVWETAVVVLTALAFVLIGLQVGSLALHAQPGALARWSGIAGAVFATVVGMRLAWVLSASAVLRLRGVAADEGEVGPGWRSGLVIGWSGMRGIVTVATALALPPDFPEHDLLLFTAFTVALGTLVLQGLTLGPLVRWLALSDDGPVEREIREARIAMAEASLAVIDGDTSPEAKVLRREFALEQRTADDADDGDGHARLPLKALHAKVLERRRETLLSMRDGGTIGDDAFHELEEELDFADLATAQPT